MMKPGRELDVLVAQNVMDLYYRVGRRIGKSTAIPDISPYSTDIAAAWEVVEKLIELGWDNEISTFINLDDTRRYRVVINEIGNQQNAFCVFANTAPHAICLAALKAVENDGTTQWCQHGDKNKVHKDGICPEVLPKTKC